MFNKKAFKKCVNMKEYMKFIGSLIVVLMSIVSMTVAQKPTEKLKPSNGDEQGLEVPKSLLIPQDKETYTDALKGWYTIDKNAHPHRADWFIEAHFGGFVHWGVYSSLAGEWKGIGNLGYGEHIMRSRKIPLAEYKEKVVAQFNPILFDADTWMKTAADAGMKYYIITAKHHDGFAMFPSSAYPYDIRQTKMYQDPIKALSVAAKKYGIKFGFYYSHAFDWEHPDAPGNDWDYDNPGGDKLLHGANWWETYPEFLPRAEKYVNEKAIPQILELIKNYHPDILWFDTPHKLPMYLNLKIIKTIRDADPNIVVNGRLARMGNINFGDYVNTGDRAAFFRPTPGLWEAIPTTNESYGYNKFDSSHKSPSHFIRLLASAVAKGGNILLNVGPKGDGAIDSKDVSILKNVGKWLKVNGESIYGAKKNPLAIQNWGEITQRGNNLYLHVFQWPTDKRLIIGGLNATIKKAYLLAEPKHSIVGISRINNTDIAISLDGIKPDTANTVIKLECDNIINANSISLLSHNDTNTLLVFDASTPGKEFSYGDGKRNRNYATNWKSKDQYLQWNVRLNNESKYKATLQYNTAKNTDSGRIVILVDDKSYPISYVPTVNSNTIANLSIPSTTLSEGNHIIKLQLDSFKGTQTLQPMALELVPIKD